MCNTKGTVVQRQRHMFQQTHCNGGLIEFICTQYHHRKPLRFRFLFHTFSTRVPVLVHARRRQLPPCCADDAKGSASVDSVQWQHKVVPLHVTQSQEATHFLFWYSYMQKVNDNVSVVQRQRIVPQQTQCNGSAGESLCILCSHGRPASL